MRHDMRNLNSPNINTQNAQYIKVMSYNHIRSFPSKPIRDSDQIFLNYEQRV